MEEELGCNVGPRIQRNPNSSRVSSQINPATISSTSAHITEAEIQPNPNEPHASPTVAVEPNRSMEAVAESSNPEPLLGRGRRKKLHR